MGLLDDAIREHLELKRRRGADPGEIAHQERAALDPVLPAEPEAVDDEVDLDPVPHRAAEPGAETQGEELMSDPEDAGGAALPDEVEAEVSELSNVGQETAELDMEEVLGADSLAPPAAGGAGAQPSDGAGARTEDSLEWEVPRRAAQEAPPEETPGQERLTFE
jgi:hypothetical protein